jgi:hypothetical protein
MSGCGRCHECGEKLRTVLDGEEWCDRCGEYRRYRAHGWTATSYGCVCPLWDTFLIAPVRGYPKDQWAKEVSALVADGWRVYWPARDTEQDDDTGMSICRANRAAIEDADAVHLIWDGKSTGCLFDLGMAFAMRKPLFVLSLPDSADSGRSFVKVVTAWSRLGYPWSYPPFLPQGGNS